jgi:hypothetical protein
MVQQRSASTGKRPCAIQTHRLVSAEPCSSGQRLSQVSHEVRKDHLCSKSTRRDRVGPPQAIDVASQAFAPDRLDFVGSKAVQLTARRYIALPKGLLPPSVRREKTEGKGRGINHTHPAFSSSARGFDGSSSDSCPVASRPGDRFPGRSCCFGFGDGSSVCACAGGAVRDPRSPRRVKSRSSAPPDSVSSASLSSALRQASSTRVSDRAV